MKITGSLLLSTLIALSAPWTSWADNALSMIVTVENIKNREGKIAVTLFDSKEAYLKKPLGEKSAEIGPDRKAIARFDDLPKGVYPISIIHDINKNGSLDTSFLRIPKEPYAFSNNATGRFGPPKFEKTKFALAPGKREITIRFD